MPFVESSLLDCFQTQSSKLDSTKQRAIKNAGSFRFRRSGYQTVADGLNRLHLVSLHTLLTLDGDEGNLLAFLQGLEAGALDGTEVHKQVRAAFRGDEAEALGVVEPLDGAGLTIRHLTNS